ncbi:hypothetical protein EBR66_00050 [bacterium]|nr:hypothetical protein [bacterium]
MENLVQDKELFEKITKDRTVRRAITRESHLMFFYVYFSHYVTYEIAEFQKDIFRITEDQSNPLAVIVAFRGSGKSTLVTFSYSLWAMLGVHQKKFVLIIGQTQTQAKQYLINLKRELESNSLLRNDLGPFQEESGEWGASALVFPQLKAKIMAVSSEQSIRGLRHNQHRPDLIICDDLEDMASVKTYENRQKIYNWLCGEVMPLGDRNTRFVVVGNLLHEDSLVMRLRRDIDEGQRKGIFKMFPLLTSGGTVAWPGKYPTQETIAEEKMKSGNEYAWQREYLLRIVPDEDQVIHLSWIQYYDALPKRRDTYHGVFMGVDLAISQKETADYTAMVSALISHEESFCVYILPNIINRRMNFPDTIKQIKAVSDANKKLYSSHILVEEVGYQKAVIDQLTHDSLDVEGVKISSDKRSRLISISAMIQSGKIKFPRHGAEALIQQIVGFGVERHDDLVDAFTIVAHHAIQFDHGAPQFLVINLGPDRWDDGEGWYPLNWNTRF